MEISEENNIALSILKNAINDYGPSIPYALVETLYKTEMEHQFDQDRSVSRNEANKIIENYLDILPAGEDNANT